MSGAVAAVDVVRAHHDPGELLREVVRFVGRFRTTEQSELAPAMRGKAASNTVECFVPGRRTELAVNAHQRLGKPLILHLTSLRRSPYRDVSADDGRVWRCERVNFEARFGGKIVCALGQSDDHIAPLVSAVYVSVRVDDVVQGIGTVDHGPDLAFHRQFAEQNQVFTTKFRCPVVD